MISDIFKYGAYGIKNYIFAVMYIFHYLLSNSCKITFAYTEDIT